MRKNHKAWIISWTGRALHLAWYRAGKPFFAQEQGDSVVGAPGGRPIGPPRSAEKRLDFRFEFFSRRCFLRITALLPGHKLGFPWKKRQ